MRAFDKFHPAAAFLYFVSVITVVIFTNHPVILAQGLAGALCFWAVLSGGKEFWHDFTLYITLLTGVILINPVFSHDGVTPLFFMNSNPVTMEAILCGISIGIMLVSIMLWFKCFNSIMTSDKLIYIFGRLSPGLSLVLSMSLRFIPLFKERVKELEEAQKGIGLHSGKDLGGRFHTIVRLFPAVVTQSLEHAAESGGSMRARGYFLQGRTYYSNFKWTGRDIGLAALSVALSAAVLTGRAFGGAEFYFYPRISSLTASPASMLCYISFGILGFLPFITEVEETLRWNYFVRKI